MHAAQRGKALKLDKLLSVLGGNPMYSVTVREGLVELRARAPSALEASSVSEGVGEERSVVVILKVDENSDLAPLEAYVEGPGGRRPIPLDEIRWWLDVLDSMA